jgi:penicillin amidase
MYSYRVALTYLLVVILAITQGCSDDENNASNNVSSDTNIGDVDDVTDEDAQGEVTPSERVLIEDLTAPADVRLDQYGVVHTSCATNDDCFAVQGYYHAAHRFAQMDLRRRLARGRLSSLLVVDNPPRRQDIRHR